MPTTSAPYQPQADCGQRVAVIGAGISGLASAWLLAPHYQVTLFEANSYPGGHTNTVEIDLEGRQHPVDTGFLVFNDRTYPNLIALFAELDVPIHASEMSFAVSLDQGRREWAGTDLNGVFAQRSNLLSPGFWSMLRDILRFNRLAEPYLARCLQDGATLGQLLDTERYGTSFRDWYLLPMAAAIWSSAPRDILDFPAATFLRFCLNHALLQINGRPQWKTVLGGGREYVKRMLHRLPDLRLNSPVRQIRRHGEGVSIQTDWGSEHFDAVILATHAPDSLRLLVNPSAEEVAVLGAIRYQPNLAILHTDPALLPQRRSVWSAWNYLGSSGQNGEQPVCVSYLLNRLQPLPFTQPVVVTLNPTQEPASRHELARFHYDHPVFDSAAIAAQHQLTRLQGHQRCWFAGAWGGYGFHEDGLKSGLRVAADFIRLPEWARV